MLETNKHAVLLVDDEPEILYSLQGLLRREFEVYTAEGGPTALAILAERPIHVVMTDQRMPEMTGTDLLDRVRSEYPETVCILFTGYADIKAVVDAVNRTQLFRYITKPWDPDDLIAVLRQAAVEYERLREPGRLLAQARSHLERAARIAPKLLAPGHPAAAEFNQWLAEGQQLISRLRDATEP